MATLRRIVLTREKAPMVFRDCQTLLDDEVSRKRGVSGLAIKTGYKVVKTFKPGFLRRVLFDLVPQFCDALEPLHERHRNGLENGNEEKPKESFGAFMQRNEGEVTAALLSVTDGKAEKSANKRVKKWYLKLRPAAERNVREAIPGLAELMDKHYATNGAA